MQSSARRDTSGRLAITTESGKTYFSNGVCQCEAYRRSTACKHRALFRLYAIASEIEETVPEAVSLADDVAASDRKTLIVEIKAAWPKSWGPIEVELLRRFRCSDLNFFAEDVLRDIRLAIAA